MIKNHVDRTGGRQDPRSTGLNAAAEFRVAPGCCMSPGHPTPLHAEWHIATPGPGKPQLGDAAPTPRIVTGTTAQVQSS